MQMHYAQSIYTYCSAIYNTFSGLLFIMQS